MVPGGVFDYHSVVKIKYWARKKFSLNWFGLYKKNVKWYLFKIRWEHYDYSIKMISSQPRQGWMILLLGKDSNSSDLIKLVIKYSNQSKDNSKPGKSKTSTTYHIKRRKPLRDQGSKKYGSDLEIYPNSSLSWFWYRIKFN